MRLAGGITALALMIAACNGGETPTQNDSPPTIAPTTRAASQPAPAATHGPTSTTTTLLRATDVPPDGSFTWTRRDGDASSIPFGNVVPIPSGFAVVEAAVGSGGGYLWTSDDGSQWERADLPVDGATQPLLVHTQSGYWLSSNAEDERMWHSSDFASWDEIDIRSMGDAFPVVRPYVEPGGPVLVDLSPWNARGAVVSAGDAVVTPWARASGEMLLAVSDSFGAPFAPSDAPWGTGFARIVPFEDRLVAYAGGLLGDPVTTIWTSVDGRTWEGSGTVRFADPTGAAEVHSYDIAERDGTLLALVGHFCYVDALWRSTDGIEWEHLGDSPDRGQACGGSLQAASFGWVLVTDGGTELPEPNVWVSLDGDRWELLDTVALGLEGGDGSTPRSQLGVSVVGDHIFIQSLLGDERSIWVGRYWREESPSAEVSIGEGTCHSTVPRTSETGRISLEVHNRTSGMAALVMGVYVEGHGQDDLEDYGRDVSVRPDFLEALEIYDVAAGETAAVEFDQPPGTYFVVCMDTTSTAIVLDDLTVLPS
jgi:hypothetical protein